MNKIKYFWTALKIFGSLGVVFSAVFLALAYGWLGIHDGPGIITQRPIPKEIISQRTAKQLNSANSVGQDGAQQILFGDLHAHTTLSFDAFIGSLPMMHGEGSRPLADACDFARFCSALDFWSINDHAEASTPRRWSETVESIQQCNAVGGNGQNPDTVAFLGWEWTQVGATPETHYGHKNVIFRDIETENVPSRPIHSGGIANTALRGLPLRNGPLLFALDPNQRMLDFNLYLHELRQSEECEKGKNVWDLPSNCRESAETPSELFTKLDEWGFESMVIPHGTTWGFYTPPGSEFNKQLSGDLHDPERQTLLEVFSGHGNSEEYRSFRAIEMNEAQQPICPKPTENYLPSCHRAGQIIEERCLEAGESQEECSIRAATARQDYVNVGTAGHYTVRGEKPEDWLDSGQCKDCYLPAFNYRPGGAAQYIMALTNFDDPENPRRFRFGFMASSDIHSARPGTGYKEFSRRGMTESVLGPVDENAEKAFRFDDGAPTARSDDIYLGETLMAARSDLNMIKTTSKTRRLDIVPLLITERERQASFFTTGGLIAVHSDGRDRNSIWNSMKKKSVYGTSGDRILLWFDLENADGGKKVSMGDETLMGSIPQFKVSAIGAFEQKPGCPEYSYNALSPERLEDLCRGECYNPSDIRKIITRIEVIRILPQISPDEDVSTLIQDPWKIIECPLDPDGCTVNFEDEEYPNLDRDAVYYVRAIQSPSLAVNADNLRCEYDENGNCIKANLCFGDHRGDPNDDCLAMNEERAWSSPIFVDNLNYLNKIAQINN